MDSLIWNERPQLQNPIFIAAFGGWSDAQESATGGVHYLIHELQATKFAELDPEEFYVFVRMRPIVNFNEEGDRSIRWPTNEFFYWKNLAGSSDVILFVGLEPHIHWKQYANALLEVAEAYHASPIYVLGSFLDGTPHTRTPGVIGIASTPQLREVLAEAGVSGVRVRPQYQGPTGVSTVFTLACQKKGLEHAGIWGRAPHYLQISPNPKVSQSLLQSLLRALPLPVSLSPLQKAVTEFDKEVEKALADNAELQGYVRKLEQQYDANTQESLEQAPQGQPGEELPSTESVLRDVEEFFRRRPPADGGDETTPPGQAG
ncbi:MAG: PAC2 family protein [Dehalococcoidia bacterium]|nr:PAC2 family protein [Dehalococcoidia bacterium]